MTWVLENRVRREILIFLADGAKSFNELYEIINFSPKPLLIANDEYDCKVRYQWTKETLENHLLNLEWYHLITKSGDEYKLSFPILRFESLAEIANYINKFSEAWIKIIKETKSDIDEYQGQGHDGEGNRLFRQIGGETRPDEVAPLQHNRMASVRFT